MRYVCSRRDVIEGLVLEFKAAAAAAAAEVYIFNMVVTMLLKSLDMIVFWFFFRLVAVLKSV